MKDNVPIEILLVEDNPYDVELTLRALKQNYITNHILTVWDGAEALEFIFCTGAYAQRDFSIPKLILLDLKLPKFNGVEVLQRIKADPRTRLIPVVVITTSNAERDVGECYRLGINSYIVKSLDFKQFSEAIRQIGLLLAAPEPAPAGGATSIARQSLGVLPGGQLHLSRGLSANLSTIALATAEAPKVKRDHKTGKNRRNKARKHNKQSAP